jgi:hypothetical protein
LSLSPFELSMPAAEGGYCQRRRTLPEGKTTIIGGIDSEPPVEKM